MYRAPERRARVRRRHRAVGVGPRRLEPGRQPGRPQHAAGDGQPVRRHGRAAGDAAGRARRGVAPSTDTTAPTATITAPPATRRRRHRRSRSPAPRPTPAAASWPASRSRPTAAAPGIPATGHDELVLHAGSAHGAPSTTIKVRATDDSGNIETPGAGAPVDVTCPCSLWGTERHARRRPRLAATRRRSRSASSSRPTRSAPITGIRFYKAAANTGTHIGSLWTADGQRLAQATFTGETASGWQTVTFADAGRGAARTRPTSRPTTRPNGHYAATRRLLLPRARARPERRRDRRQRRRCTRSATPAPTTNGVYGYGAVERVPDQLLRRRQLLGRRDLHADAAPGHGDRTSPPTEGGQHLGQRDLVGARERRHADLLQDHAVRRLDGADAEDRHRLAAGDDDDDHRPDDRHDLHASRSRRSNPNGAGPGVGAVERRSRRSAPSCPAAPTGVDRAARRRSRRA